ncbi:MAG: LA_3659 family protein [Sphaerochaetaceae bacterium]
MQSIQLFDLIFPLLLTGVTLVLVLVLIAQLRKEIRLSKLKSVADQYMLKVDSASKLMEGRILQFEEQIETRIREGNELISRTSSQIEDLSGYSQDLANLKVAMTTYHHALDELAQLTMKSDDELGKLEKRSELFDAVTAAIDRFEAKFQEMEKRLSEGERHLASTLFDFCRRTDEKISDYEADNNSRITAFEARVGGVVGAFEARFSGDLNLFDTQMDSKIDECQKQISSDVERHEKQIRAIKEDNLKAFEEAAGKGLESNLEKLNSAFAAIAESTKELSSELDEKTSALGEIVGGFDSLADEKIQELERRSKSLGKEKEELARIRLDKETALKELEDIQREKFLIKAMFEGRTNEVERQDTGVVFTPIPVSKEEPFANEPVKGEFDDWVHADSPGASLDAPSGDDAETAEPELKEAIQEVSPINSQDSIIPQDSINPQELEGYDDINDELEYDEEEDLEPDEDEDDLAYESDEDEDDLDSDSASEDSDAVEKELADELEEEPGELVEDESAVQEESSGHEELDYGAADYESSVTDELEELERSDAGQAPAPADLDDDSRKFVPYGESEEIKFD